MERKKLCRKVKSMVRTVFISGRCRSLCYKFNTFPNFDQRKVCKMYERFLEELQMYSKVIGICSKGSLLISLLPPSKLERILSEVKVALSKTNNNYNLVLTRLYLYYDMKFATFGIDENRFLIVQLPVFVQPYTQRGLVMYQIKLYPFQFWTEMIKHSHTHY